MRSSPPDRGASVNRSRTAGSPDGGPAVAVRPRPVLLALDRAAGAPGDCAALAELDGTTLLGRLLRAYGALDLAPALVLAPSAAADAVGHEVHVARETGARVGDVITATDRAAALRAALAACDEELLLLHDVERALAPSALVQAVMEALEPAHDAVVPAIDVTDSVKRVTDGGLVNVDRSSLVTLQSPRLLRRAALERALAASGARTDAADAPGSTAQSEGFDEVDALLAQGAVVHRVHGSHDGFAVRDRLSLWQAQISLGIARDTTHRHDLGRRR